MNRLLLILVLMFSFQSFTKADDIRDFEIDGLSLGESLLKFYDKKDLTTNTADYYSDNTYASQGFYTTEGSLYEGIQVSYLTNDKKFKAEAINGELDFPNDINNCYRKMDEVKKVIVDSLPNIAPSKKVTFNNSAHGIFTYIDFIFDSGDLITISCYDYDGTKFSWIDIFRLSLETKEYRKWIDNEAYK